MEPQPQPLPQPEPAAEPTHETQNGHVPSQWNVNKNHSFSAPLTTPNAQNSPFYNVPQQNVRQGADVPQNTSSDEVPNEAEIDDFLNDA